MHAEARIDLNALQHNLLRVRELAPMSKILAVIKANGYGHGIVPVATALGDADAYAVANLEEALTLRNTGFDKPIVLLEGLVDEDELQLASIQQLELVVHHPHQLELLEKVKLAEPMRIWLKIDTGMHRIGISPDSADACMRRLYDCPQVKKPIRIMSHFANADQADDPSIQAQFELFQSAVRGMRTELSIANSAAIFLGNPFHQDWVRPGIMLYGANPFPQGTAEDLGLQPVMTLSTRLIAVNTRRKGDVIGYGSTWSCPEDMSLGVAAIGYGDGYPRHAVSGTPVLVNGTRAQIVGRVSMDMICIDLRDCADARIGDPVVLWGEGLPVDEVAQCANTISYELLCKITSRVSLHYTP